jgi:hypothetical protein
VSRYKHFPVRSADGTVHACVHASHWDVYAEELLSDRRKTVYAECDSPSTCRALAVGDDSDVDCLVCLASRDYLDSERWDPRER